jgi:hypothetical protein
MKSVMKTRAVSETEHNIVSIQVLNVTPDVIDTIKSISESALGLEDYMDLLFHLLATTLPTPSQAAVPANPPWPKWRKRKSVKEAGSDSRQKAVRLLPPPTLSQSRPCELHNQ